MQVITILSIVGITAILLFISYSASKPKTDNLAILPTLSQSSPTIPVATTAQQTNPSQTVSPTGTTRVISKATIATSKGNIFVTFFPETPNTVNNFVTKAESNFYNNLTFHRVEDWVVQGGDPEGDGTGGGNIPVEFNNKPFVVGSLGVASRGDGKVQNDAQFFITKTDASWLNGQYTNFGQVIDGMDVVEKIAIGDKILRITVE